ncbi:MAG TPA: tetratricopeptide repeat protein [Pseudonocardiaceae bacterium]
MDDRQAFGDWLRRERRRAGLTQEDLAERSGLSVRAISDLERGRTRKPYPSSVQLLTTALGLPADAAEWVARQRIDRIGGAAPAQLPSSVRHFTGRLRELKILSGLLTQATEHGGTVVISAIDGTAGIGKTALAVHWAHLNADRFPDGQLYVNLRGFDPMGEPLDAHTVVQGFLDSLGVPAARVPADLDTRVALYRSTLAHRRVLILLDNAKDADQIRPLLPGAEGCVVLVTSRNQLAGLVAVEGAHPVTLDLLAADEAHELLNRRLGAERIARDERAADELVELCARLPLALNIAAARAVIDPDLPLAAVVAELRDTRRRLDLLSTGDTSADVRAVLSWSYRALDAGSARVFRLISQAPGADVDAQAVAALVAAPADVVESALGTLVDANLLHRSGAGRYRFHDLLRVYAAEQAELLEPRAELDAGVRRLLVWYLRAAVDAAHIISPDRRLPSLDGLDTVAALPDCRTYEDAVAWSDGEYAGLIAAVDVADRHGWHEIVWKLAIALWDVCHLRGRSADLIAIHQRALDSARTLDDRAAEGWLLSHLSVAYADAGRPASAIECLTQALAIDRATGNRRSEAVNLVNLGYAYFTRNQFTRAVDTLTDAVTAARESGHWRAEAAALNDMGEAYLRLGRLAEARDVGERGLTIYRARADRQGEGAALGSLGEISRLMGDARLAMDQVTTAIEINRETGNRREEANVLTSLGYLLLAENRRDEARQRWLDAETIFADIDDPRVAEVRTQLDGLT